MTLFLCKMELGVNWLWFLGMIVPMLHCVLFTKLKVDFCSACVKFFDYGKIKCYGNCFFTDLICWFYSRLIPKPS